MSNERLLMKSDTMIIATDERGPGHANHRYQVCRSTDGEVFQLIVFQKGPIQEEEGVNGIQNEDLLSIVIDRLIGFQTGDYACLENEDALNACILACTHLQKRTAKRKARNVEGTSQK